MIGEISIVPVGGEASSMRTFVDKAVDAIRSTGVRMKTTEMGTNVEGSLDEIMQAFKGAHDACLNAGAPRVMATLRIDDRLDMAEHLHS